MGKRKVSLFSLVFILCLFAFAKPVFATSEEAPTQASSDTAAKGGFYYQIVRPDFQRDTSVNYFDLRMTPGQQETVHIDFTNTGDSDIAFNVGLYGAKTNQNGVIEYGPTSIENDASLAHPFEEVVTTSNQFVAVANETTPLELAIQMPAESFDGMISGGIWFQVAEEDDPDATGVIQKTAYVIGMVLSETDNPVTAEMVLNDVYAKLDNYRGAIYANMSNTTAVYHRNVTAEVTIAAASNPDDILYDSKITGMMIAPNSFLDYPISLGGDRYRAGDYLANVSLTSDQGSWNWTQEFTITEDLETELNEQDVSLVQEQGVNWLFVATIGGGLFIVIVLVYVIIRYRRQKQKQIRKAKLANKRKRNS
ncbi:DUF916 and DUF3324 domain-containing protein [Enterococcus sp. LJL120]